MVEVPRLLYINNDTHMAADRAETLSSAYELTVHTASDVSTAKAVLTSHDIDCVVSEFRLGGDDGFDLLSHVRSEHSSLPVILLIDDEPDGVARDAFNSGATDLFPRSMLELSYDPLVDRIHELTDAATSDATDDTTTPEASNDATTPETTDDTTTPETADSSPEPAMSAASNSEPEPTPATTSTAETATSTDGGGAEAVTGGSSAAADTTTTDTADRTPEESTTAAGGGKADSLSGLNLAELRELPKDELIALLAEIIGEDDGADLRLATSDDGAESFGEPSIILESDGHSDAPKLAVDEEGTLHLAYGESPEGMFEQYHVRYARQAKDEEGFGSSRRISEASETTAQGAHFPSLALGARDALLMLWNLYPTGEHPPRGLGFTASVDGGNSFYGPSAVPGSTAESLGINGSLQGMLMEKIAANASGQVAVVNSRFKRGIVSRIRLYRGQVKGANE